MAYLSEAQAWHELAARWTFNAREHRPKGSLCVDNKSNDDTSFGLCDTLLDLRLSGLISSDTYRTIKAKIALQPQENHRLYCWSHDVEGQRQRVNFCLQHNTALVLNNPSLAPNYEQTCVRHVTIPTAHALLTLQANSNTDTENCMITDSGNIPVEFAVISIVSISSSIQNLPKK